MTNMTKEQLEQLLRCTLTDYECGRIKECISYFSGDYELFETKENIFNFYHTFGIDGINRLHCHHVTAEKTINRMFEKSNEDYKKYLDLLVKYTVLCNRLNESCDEPDEWTHEDESHEDESVTSQPVDMGVLKEHFESITNCTVTDNEYYRIEKCINAFSDLLASDDDIALFYHTFGINGIDHLLCDLAGFEAAEEHNLNHCREVYHAEHGKYLEVCIKNSQLSSYISAFLQALVKLFNEILSDPLFSFDYSKSVFHALIDYLNKEIKRFESEVK